MQISWNFLHELINDIFYNFLIDRTICKKNKWIHPPSTHDYDYISWTFLGYFFFRLVSG